MPKQISDCHHLLLTASLLTAGIILSGNTAVAGVQEPAPGPGSAEATAATVTDNVTAAAAAEATVRPNLAGVWRGHWHSDSTGHKGPMRADFECAGRGRWKVVFRGRFCALIPFQYSAVLFEEQKADGTVTLSGSRSLGPLLGNFYFRGTVSGGRLNARWWSKKESGSFVLAR